MNKIWANRLIAGTQTWERCIKAGRGEGVKAILIERVKDSTITEKKYKDITGEEYTDG